MSDTELTKLCLHVLETAWPSYLTTVDEDGAPHTRAMFNLRNKDRFPKLIPLFEDHATALMVIFTTNTSSEKIPHILDNPRVSAYYCNSDNWQGVMLGGTVEIVKEVELKKEIWHDGWERYYPKGYDDTDHTVLRLLPSTVKGWTGSQTFKFRLE